MAMSSKVAPTPVGDDSASTRPVRSQYRTLITPSRVPSTVRITRGGVSSAVSSASERILAPIAREPETHLLARGFSARSFDYDNYALALCLSSGSQGEEHVAKEDDQSTPGQVAFTRHGN